LAVAIHPDSSVVSYARYKLAKPLGDLEFVILAKNLAEKWGLTENFVNDIKQGILRSFYTSGKTKSVIPYEKGKPDGTAYEYSEDSLITAIIVYKGGILQSFEKINQRDPNNKKQGIWKEFYENLEVKKEMKFNDDSLDGYVKQYDKKGNLLSTKKFNNGKQILNAPEIANVELYTELFKDGTLKYEGVYSDGVSIGTHFKYKQKYQCDSSLILKDDSTLKEPLYMGLNLIKKK
jgi:antitoxin component YwqK of YwqJK toxin-antitoxin module